MSDTYILIGRPTMETDMMFIVENETALKIRDYIIGKGEVGKVRYKKHRDVTAVFPDRGEKDI